MTWLFPFYLLGAAAIIAPILMHLRRRPPQRTLDFSSLMFLQSQTPVPISKRRLDHWLLLLLRCLLLILLALMFSRPLWHQAQNASQSRGEAIAILWDRSASMQRGDLWKQARTHVEKTLQSLKSEDRIMVATFDHQLNIHCSFDEGQGVAKLSEIKPRLADLQPGWGQTDIGKALQATVSQFENTSDMAGRKKRIILISDMQEGAHLEALRGIAWPENIPLNLLRVDAPNVDNLSLAQAANAPDTDAQPQDLTKSSLRVRLANMRDSKAGNFQLAWQKRGSENETLRGYIPPGATRVISAPPVKDLDTARTLLLSGDAWDFDNRLYIAPMQPQKAKVVFIGDPNSRDIAASPLYYLSRALQPTPSVFPELSVIPSTATELPTDSNIIFITGTTLPEALTKSLHSFMEKGGLCVHVLSEGTSAAVLQSIAKSSALRITEGTLPPDGYLMLSEVDSKHPLLRPFKDERLRDFTKLRFWKFRKLEAGTNKEFQTIASFDNGSPAILTRTFGKGRLLILTAGWHPADSQLALSTKFVPMLYGWLEAAGFASQQTTSFTVGDILPIEDEAAVVTPNKLSVKVQSDKPFITELPGFYTITPKADANAKPLTIAVNLPPEESRINPLEAEVFRQYGIPLENAQLSNSEAGASERVHMKAAEEEKQQRAWMWILAAILVLLAMETWLANRLRSTGQVQPAAT